MFLRIINSIFIVAIVVCTVLYTCSVVIQASESVDKKPKIGVFIFRSDDAYISLVTKSIQESLKYKADLTVFDAQQDQVLQTDQLVKYLGSGVDAVAINLVDVKVGQSIINLVHNKGIPLILFNKEPDLKSIKNYRQTRFVGSKARQSAILQGKIISELWHANPSFDRNNDGVCNYLMLQGEIDNPESLLRTKLSVVQARKDNVKMQQVGDTIICNWDAECAHNATSLALKIYKKEIDMIISNNDSMALGAIEALQEIGFNVVNGENVIPVVGIDGILEAKKAIAQGIMHGTIVQDAQAMGKCVATMLLNGVEKKPFLENLPYSWDKSGVAIRIPYYTHERK